MYTVNAANERKKVSGRYYLAVVHPKTLSKDMVIITVYEIKRNNENDLFYVVSKEDPCCPYCGTKLKFEDHVVRHRKLAGGEKQWYTIERRRCPAGCGIHRLIPDFLAPHKHYDIDIITGVLNGTINPDLLAFEDYPCEKTMERWQKWIELNLVFINAYLKSVGIRLFAIGIALAYAATDLVEELKSRNRHGWLKIVIRAVYNTGASLEPYRDRTTWPGVPPAPPTLSVCHTQ